MKYLLYILNILILPALWSCTNDDVPFKQEQQEGEVLLTLTLKSATLTTRTEAGVTDLNENAIHKVDLFLYPTGKTNENAVVQKTDINNFTSQDDGEVTFTVPITSEQKDYLFPAGSNNICVGYAIANRPGDFSAPKKTVDNTAVDDTSMEALKNIVISSTTFEASEDKGTDDQKTIAIKAGRQADFVMDGYTDGTTYKIELTTSNDSQEIVTGTIPLDRAASKITLGVTVTKNVTEDGVTWTPGNAEVLFYHGVKQAKVDVTYNDNTAYTPVAKDYFDLTGSNARQLTKSDLNYTQEVPFYSYSSDWGNGEKEAYLVLVLYWTPQVDGGNPTPFYYRVPINPESNNIVRNTYYKINLEVGILGSRELNTETVTLSPSCILLDWGNNNITADLKQPRYLVVDKDIVYVYNDENCKVEYETSHALSYEIISITKPYYKNITASTEIIYDKENNVGSTDGFSLTVSNGIINANNPLDNNINSDGFDYVPYTIKVRVYHNDNTDYSEEVTFIQYPAVYVQNSLNEGGNLIYKEKNDDESYWNNDGYEDNGWVFVNSQEQNDYDGPNYGASSHWDTVEGFDTSSKNPNMYIVTTTVLDNTLNYILGDSRESATYTYSDIGTGNSKDSNGSTLQKYRPTKTDRNDYLSPKFRISSAYGQLGNNDISIANAKKRCAAYQEYGYPAGRWRLPTTAELSYIAKLCAKGALPISLFGGSSYWSATQAYYVSQGNVSESSDNSAYLRCVYDDWYWGSNALNKKDKFTWGDESTTDELNKMDSQK